MTAATVATAITVGGNALSDHNNMKSSPLSFPDEKSTVVTDQSAPTSSTASSSSTDTNGSGPSSNMDDDDVDASNYNGRDEDDKDTDRNNYHDNTLHQYFTKSHTRQMDKLAQDENRKLNLNLGLPIDLTVYTRRESGETDVTDSPPDDNITAFTGIIARVLRPPIQVIIYILDRLVSYIESPLFQFWDNCIPLYIRQKLTFFAWSIYLPLHKFFIGRRSGLHRDVSLEYHALTSVLWWGRLVRKTADNR